MARDKDEPLLKAELDFVSRQAREYALDAIYCTLFNTANDLAGNSADGDVPWFARSVYDQVKGFNTPPWDRLDEEERERWLRIAAAALDRLPHLMGRIEHRCRTQAQILQTLLREQYKATKRSQEEAARAAVRRRKGASRG